MKFDPEKVKRWEPELKYYYYGDEYASMNEDTHGEYVAFEDFERIKEENAVLKDFLRLTEHKLDQRLRGQLDQRLRGQYTNEYILGMLLMLAREILLRYEIEALQ